MRVSRFCGSVLVAAVLHVKAVSEEHFADVVERFRVERP